MESIEFIEKYNEVFDIKRREPESIFNQQFIDSFEVLRKYEYTLPDETKKISQKICEFCNINFPIFEETKCCCAECGKNYCAKHRKQENHRCEKQNPNLTKYLIAKNMFKERLRYYKNKGH